MKTILGRSLSVVLSAGLLFSQIALGFEALESNDPIPNCPDLDGSALPIMNSPVLQWKSGEANQFRHRARVRGYITTLYPDKNGHQHFEIQIGPDAKTDNLEVIYNEDFGDLPDLRTGMKVEACGDFIVSTAQSGDYPPSPAGAIIHWVHTNPSGRGHPPGYVWIEGKLCGQNKHAPPRQQRPKPLWEDSFATPAELF